MEPTEEGEQTISNIGVEVVATVVFEELGVEKIKEFDVAEEVEVESESRCAESISRISGANIWFSKAFDRPPRVSLNVGTYD